MKIKQVNKKGFTLIELLAVIVIMGILMMVAIPAMTRYITQAKRDTFLDTAKQYVNAVRYAYLNGELDCSGKAGMKYDVAINSASTTVTWLEKGGKSSWNNAEVNGYVQIDVNASGVATYSIALVDSDGRGITAQTKENALTRTTVNPSNSTTKTIAIPTATATETTCTYTG